MDGELTIREWKGYGEGKDSRYRKSSQRGAGYGLMMVLVSGCGLSIRIMSGAMISW
jgi:hypothetical protein